MQSYIAGILGAVLLGVVIEIVMPAGSMQKYIRGMYSIFVIFILLTPITRLVNSDYDISSLFSTQAVMINDEYIEYITINRAESMAEYLEAKLCNEGINGIDISVDYKVNEYEISLEKIQVSFDNLVINTQDKHINKYDIIIKGIMKYVSVEEDKIVFNE